MLCVVVMPCVFSALRSYDLQLWPDRRVRTRKKVLRKSVLAMCEEMQQRNEGPSPTLSV